jgi:hypothetical protein
MDTSTAAAVVYLLGGAGFFSALASLIAVLTIMRQLRSLQVYRATLALAAVQPKPTPAPPPKPYVVQMRATREMPRVRLSPSDVPVPWTLPVRAGTPDQVTIMIEPDTEPSRDKLNVTRLIDHLKKPTSAPV